MKMHAKEIIKNKADKMVDLIIDEIGKEGTKKLSASFVDKKTNIKYIIRVGIKSGDPDSLIDDIEDDEVSTKIQDIMERLVALEIREDNDTVYDDTDILLRLTTLENKPEYDDSGIKARLTVLENEETELKGRITSLEESFSSETDGDDNS